MAGQEPGGKVGEGRGRVEFVSDDGVVVLVLADGQRRFTTVSPRSVPLVRRLAAADRDLEWELPR